MDFTYYVYIMASRKYGYMYVGITEDIARRTHEHKNHFHPSSFTAQHNIHNLVYYEAFNNVMEAIFYEKKLKKWRRQWKFNLIEQSNPTWQDLSIRFKW